MSVPKEPIHVKMRLHEEDFLAALQNKNYIYVYLTDDYVVLDKSEWLRLNEVKAHKHWTLINRDYIEYES